MLLFDTSFGVKFLSVVQMEQMGLGCVACAFIEF